MNNNNKIVVFEGPDGSGKTTQCKLLQQVLCQKMDSVYIKARVKPTDDYKMLCEMERVNNRLGNSFPKWLKSTVIAYERAKQLYNAMINNQNKILLIDKYIYSTSVYLKYIGIEYNIPKLMLEWLPEPDAVILFELGAKECMRRIKTRNSKIGRNENELFLELLGKHLDNIISNLSTQYILRIDASASQEKIHEQILKFIYSFLGESAL